MDLLDEPCLGENSQISAHRHIRDIEQLDKVGDTRRTVTSDHLEYV